jgi:hypothetical protein
MGRLRWKRFSKKEEKLVDKDNEEGKELEDK